MSAIVAVPGIRNRVIVLAALAIVFVGLVIAVFLRRAPSAGMGGDPVARAAQIARALDSTLARYGIERSDVRTWQVRTPVKRFARMEQRVMVGPDFLSLQFNHDLQKRLEPLGARVVATERARENIVTMHIVDDGMTVRSIAFLVRPSGE